MMILVETKEDKRKQSYGIKLIIINSLQMNLTSWRQLLFPNQNWKKNKNDSKMLTQERNRVKSLT